MVEKDNTVEHTTTYNILMLLGHKKKFLKRGLLSINNLRNYKLEIMHCNKSPMPRFLFASIP